VHQFELDTWPELIEDFISRNTRTMSCFC
jgi:hypothetical protein